MDKLIKQNSKIICSYMLRALAFRTRRKPLRTRFERAHNFLRPEVTRDFRASTKSFVYELKHDLTLKILEN